uniref:Scavenger receptor class B, member 2a n=1 Tax=Oryzias sinensis TaxID=183150 RepID=A0A8C7WQT7_9TELE
TLLLKIRCFQGTFCYEITLTEKSQVFESWKNPPPPVYMEYYFFNVTNPWEFLQGKKASVKQIGPYTYREYRPRENVTFLENGTKLYALNPKSFVFVPEKSAGNPEVDMVTTINIPFVAVMDELNSYSFFLRSMVSIYMSSLGVDVFMNRTVHEILWGFKDPLLSKIHGMKPDVDEYFGLMWKVSVTSVQIPPKILFLESKRGLWLGLVLRDQVLLLLQSAPRHNDGRRRLPQFRGRRPKTQLRGLVVECPPCD